jgi:hypothetical protein
MSSSTPTSCWTKKRPTRIPESILKNKFLNQKCAEKGCSFHFASTKQMYRCKGISLPVGYDNPEFISLLVSFLKEKHLELSDGCDNKDDR